MSAGAEVGTGRSLSATQITWCSGTAAGLVATFAKQPIQRIKWIRQTSEGPVRGYADIMRESFRARGWRGVFAGSSAACYRNVPHSALVYSIYPHCANFSRKVLGEARAGEARTAAGERARESFGTRFVAGYITLFAATLVTHPLDTLRVRISLEATRSYWQSARSLYAREGFSGFYSGFRATLVGAGPRGAVGFAVFESAKPRLGEIEWFKDRPHMAKFVCGYVAGILSESAVYPLDTVRRRQQALGSSHPIGQMGIMEALARIVSKEGFFGLFKGISLNLLKNPAATAVSFVINDLVKETLTGREF